MSEESIVHMLFGPSESISADCNCPASPTMVITVYGDIDLLTEQRFAQHLRHHLSPQAGATEITVDLTAVTFISAQGIAILAEAATQALTGNIRFNLAGCTPWTSRIIAMWQTLNPSDARLY